MGDAGNSDDSPLSLTNNYWLLRHGRSKPNEAGLIVSALENGIKREHGLSETGREQAKAAGLRWKEELGPDVDPETLLVVSSPFSRTLETATLASSAVGIEGFENVDDKSDSNERRFVADEALRERHFGGFELETHDHYKTVWIEDARDVRWRPPASSPSSSCSSPPEGESVADVAERLRELFSRLEASNKGKNVLIVAHGDTLSIATTVAKGCGLGRHREFAQETGELRKLSERTSSEGVQGEVFAQETAARLRKLLTDVFVRMMIFFLFYTPRDSLSLSFGTQRKSKQRIVQRQNKKRGGGIVFLVWKVGKKRCTV